MFRKNLLSSAKWFGLLLVQFILLDLLGYLLYSINKFNHYIENLIPLAFIDLHGTLFSEYPVTYDYADVAMKVVFKIIVIFIIAVVISYIYDKIKNGGDLRKKYSFLGAICGYFIGTLICGPFFSYLTGLKIQSCALKQGYIGMCDIIRTQVFFQTVFATIILVIFFAIAGYIYGIKKSK